jgi:hypothetical protein
VERTYSYNIIIGLCCLHYFNIIFIHYRLRFRISAKNTASLDYLEFQHPLLGVDRVLFLEQKTSPTNPDSLVSSSDFANMSIATTKSMNVGVPTSFGGRVPLQSRNPNTINGIGAFPVTTTAVTQGSFSSRGGGVNSSTEEYNSKDMGALNRLSNLESSQNENNKRLTSSTSYAASNAIINNNNSGIRSNNNSLHNQSSGHHPPIRRNSANDIRDGSDPGLPTSSSTTTASAATRPRATQRSNSLPALNDNNSSGDRTAGATEDVVIEEKRRNLNGEGYTIHRYLRGRMLGKGGFAKVYLCTALDTNKAYAIKIVPKANLVKARARQKVSLIDVCFFTKIL